MPKTIEIFQVSDADIVQKLQNVCDEVGIKDSVKLEFYFGKDLQPITNISFDAINENNEIARVANINKTCSDSQFLAK